MPFGDDRTVPIAVRQNRWIAALVVLVALAAALRWMLGSVGPPPATEVELDPRATFLRAASADAPPARALALAKLGLAPGDSVRLEALAPRGGAAGPALPLVAVFSASDWLRSPDRPHRLPGALEAGPERVTGPLPSGAPTDIPQDFGFGGAGEESVTVRVPEGAAYLLVAVDRTGGPAPAAGTPDSAAGTPDSAAGPARSGAAGGDTLPPDTLPADTAASGPAAVRPPPAGVRIVPLTGGR